MLALLITGAAPAVSASPSGGHTIKVGLDDSSEVPSSAQHVKGAQETGLSHPRAKEFKERIRAADAPGLKAPVPSPVQSITPEECFKHASSSRGKGYAAGRFASCQSRELRAWKVDCEWLIGCHQVGEARFSMATIRYTENHSREILEITYLGNWRPSGDMNGVSMTMNSTCTVTKGGGSCGRDDTALTKPVNSWVAERESWLYTGFHQKGGAGRNALGTADLQWHVIVNGGGKGPVSRDGSKSPVRCDKAYYLVSSGAGEGCVFSWAEAPTWKIDSSKYPETARHVWFAQNFPDWTTPPSSKRKVIPGAPGTEPLHRKIAGKDQRRGVAKRACIKYFPNKPDNTDCDEYPMASTAEGAVNHGDGSNNYSVLQIDSKDNQGAGRASNVFYATQRLMGSDKQLDAFYVRT